MSTVSTHVLDATRGAPASGVEVTLSSAGAELASARTDDDGRISEFQVPALEPGTYTLTFATGEYFARRHTETFYPEVTVTFRVGGAGKIHVPLLLSPFSYSTYRGS